jgi:hypothetical protein
MGKQETTLELYQHTAVFRYNSAVRWPIHDGWRTSKGAVLILKATTW